MKQTAGLVPTVATALSVTGFDAEAILGSAERTWLWLVAPLLGFALVGTVLVCLRWRARLDPWDLRRDRTRPTVKRLLLISILVGSALAVAFAVYNFRLEIDPRQKLWNIGLWFLGTVLGTSLALALGLGRGASST